MVQIIIGSFALSFLHAFIPNHWIPLVAVSRTSKWNRKETLYLTALIGFAHTLGTIIIGIIIGIMGYKLTESFKIFTKILAPTILIILGIIFIIIDYKSHQHDLLNENSFNLASVKSKYTVAFSLLIAMFFSPCVEIGAYYFIAGTLGFSAIIVVSIIYLIVTVFLMVILVDLGRKGFEKIKSHYFELHDKKVSGIVLIILGIFAYFIDL